MQFGFHLQTVGAEQQGRLVPPSADLASTREGTGHGDRESVGGTGTRQTLAV